MDIARECAIAFAAFVNTSVSSLSAVADGGQGPLQTGATFLHSGRDIAPASTPAAARGRCCGQRLNRIVTPGVGARAYLGWQNVVLLAAAMPANHRRSAPAVASARRRLPA